MSVVITGGSGFLGQLLAREIRAAGRLSLPDGTDIIHPDIVVADRPGAIGQGGLPGDIEVVACDVTDRSSVKDTLAGAQAVFHLAAVVSGQAERDPDLGMAVNFDGTRNVLSVLASGERPVPLVTTSSLAVFGSNAAEPVTEATPTQPRNSYGAAKAMAEIALSDARRRGRVDARILRLPTVVVRPGGANAAASGFASAIVRDALAGKPVICPVDPGLAMWVTAPETAVRAMIHAMAVPHGDWPEFAAVNVPGIRATVAEILAALVSAGGAEARDRVRMDPDPQIEAIVASWPALFDTTLAATLGFPSSPPIGDIVDSYARRMKK